jgi:hypothetical protein
MTPKRQLWVNIMFAENFACLLYWYKLGAPGRISRSAAYLRQAAAAEADRITARDPGGYVS